MMESKLLVGGKSIVDKTTEQERALEEQRIQIAEQQVGFIFNGKTNGVSREKWYQERL